MKSPNPWKKKRIGLGFNALTHPHPPLSLSLNPTSKAKHGNTAGDDCYDGGEKEADVHKGGAAEIRHEWSPFTALHVSLSASLAGSILLTARNEQVDLMTPGLTLILRNAKIDIFKGSIRLAGDKQGRIEVTDPASFEVKEDNNLSG